MDKTISSLVTAVRDIPDGASLAVGGFGLCGIPYGSSRRCSSRGRRPETVSNNCGVDGAGLGVLLRRRPHPAHGQLVRRREQGVRAAVPVRRARGRADARRARSPSGCVPAAAGIPAFYTPAGVGTLVADGGLPWRYDADGTVAVARRRRRSASSTGSEYVLEEAITADFALVRAVDRRPARQPGVPRVGAQLQPAVRDGRADHHRRGRGARRARRDRPRARCTPRASSCTGSCDGRRAPTSRSRSARTRRERTAP